MEDNIFDTEDKQKQAILLFQGLLADPAWLLFVKVLEANIAMLSRRLETEDFETIDAMRAVQRTRQAYEDAKNTPEMIVEAYSRENKENMPNIDPYQGIEEFREEMKRKRRS
jgi:hypothetical protein